MTELEEFIAMSRYAGERFDLVQAAGGNASVKYANDEMIIKASGYLLSDVRLGKGYSRVITSQVARIIKDEKVVSLESKREREIATAELIRSATLNASVRPSIETIFHASLMKYTLHTHPIAVIALSIRKDWKELADVIFNDCNVALVDYFTPGIDLAIALNSEVQKFVETPSIIILQNHGLIITSDDFTQIHRLTELVVKRIEVALHIDLGRFKLTNYLTDSFMKIKSSDNISYLVEDHYLNAILSTKFNLIFERACCPDTFVYCGYEVVNMNSESSCRDYYTKYKELPKIVLLHDKLLISAITIKKARETEEVLKLHLMTLNEAKSSVNYLTFDELTYLGNWEAEKYRQDK
jgi:rhamnose utilization protein RhaD (predicted bifunctional aldolase and dehydrogenase)